MYICIERERDYSIQYDILLLRRPDPPGVSDAFPSSNPSPSRTNNN